LKITKQIIHNNPIPPRPRSHFGADSPRRGEYGALGGPSGRDLAAMKLAAMNEIMKANNE